MHFYLIYKIRDITLNNQFPCLGFIKDNWNDYGYQTLFNVVYYNSPNDFEELGYYRIMQEGKSSTDLPSEFDFLPDEYCSLAMSDDFYTKFYKRNKNEIEKALLTLNDVSLKTEYFDKLQNDRVFNSSLLRGSSIEFIKKNYKKIIQGNSDVYNQEFSYNANLDFTENKNLELTFSFLPLDKNLNGVMNRLNCLIGKNAAGKTTILSKLAISLCSKNDEKSKIEFPKGRPHFSKIIAISFSMFDNFEHPNDFNDGTDSIVDKNYSYCGFHNSKGRLITEKQKSDKLYKSWKDIISNMNLYNEWKDFLKIFLTKEQINYISNKNITNRKDFEILLNNFKISSGQQMMFYFTTHTLANISDGALILFDEPELHLHPNAISQIIKLLYQILQQKNSYAIIATHSPIIVQQIPRKYVTIINHVDETVYTIPAPIETFGENLSILTREIFDNIDNDSYYKNMLKLMNSMFYHNTEYIKKIFDYNLSINAEFFLENLKNVDL